MKGFLLSLIVPILTFCAGVYSYRISTHNVLLERIPKNITSTPNISLGEISKNITFYNEIDVEIETYAYILNADENTLFVGNLSEKYEGLAFLNLEDNTTNLDDLQFQLKERLTRNQYKRARILIRGSVHKIYDSCCYKNSVTIKAREVIQLAPVEDFILPK